MNSTEKFLNFFRGGILLCAFFLNWSEGQVNSQIPSVGERAIFSEPSKAVPGPEKNYTGIRVKSDSLLQVYYHGQTVAVVEVGSNRALFNCELLEVKTKADQKVALNSLKPIVPNQTKIAFRDMMDLMAQCQKLDSPVNLERQFVNENAERILHPKEFTSLFSGVFPGTKWCGAGDLAKSYYDLGTDKELDKCCRTHDLCPIKVGGLKSQYNLTNYGVYSRSHCVCDEFFYDCLKSRDTKASNLIGNIYFNVSPVTCVEDVSQAGSGINTEKRFATLKKRY